MWRAIIGLSAALILGVPNLARAQYSDTDNQNPKEYTDEDSNPLRMLAYLVSPIGFALEWGIARPMHYIATDTFLAPVFNSDTRPPEFHPPATAYIPLDDVGDEPPHPSRFPSDGSHASAQAQRSEDTRAPSTGIGSGTSGTSGQSGQGQPVIVH